MENGIFTYIFSLIMYGFHVGKYTSPIDAMGMEPTNNKNTPNPQ